MYKIELNSKAKFDGGAKVNENFDIIFYDYMIKQYKLKAVVEEKIEEALLAVDLYSGI